MPAVFRRWNVVFDTPATRPLKWLVMDEPKYFETWELIRSLLRESISDAKSDYGIALEIIEQPERTIVIRDNRRNGMTVQVSISLRGDAIEIKRRDTKAGGAFADEEPETIEINMKNGVLSYTHDDLDRTTDPNRVVEIILGPILDFYRAA